MPSAAATMHMCHSERYERAGRGVMITEFFNRDEHLRYSLPPNAALNSNQLHQTRANASNRLRLELEITDLANLRRGNLNAFSLSPLI